MAIINSEETRRKVGEKGIEWKSIPAMSPNMNSIAKVMVRETKTSLYTTFNGQRFTQSELKTALKLAQSSLDSPPSIAISDDIEYGNILTLSLAHLVLGRALTPFIRFWVYCTNIC